MAYQSWSVVAGEQPSAAKWNILGTNDAAFNNGTGFSWTVSTQANAGTAGGTMSYINLGGIKRVWGLTASNGTGTGGTAYTITFPTSFFSSVTYASVTPAIVGTSNNQYAVGTGISTTTFAFNAHSDTNGSTQTTSFLAIGT